jgi:hypothetical protein
MAYAYGLRWGGLALSALVICMGGAMTFAGLDGSFNWAVQVPTTISAKMTNASPGIVFATIGVLLGLKTMSHGTLVLHTELATFGGPSPRRFKWILAVIISVFVTAILVLAMFLLTR